MRDVRLIDFTFQLTCPQLHQMNLCKHVGIEFKSQSSRKFARVPLLQISMPKPSFGPHVDDVQKRERMLALSQRIFQLGESIDENYECDPQILALSPEMEQIMTAIKIQVFFRRRAMARIARDDDDGVVNAQLAYEQ